MSQLMEPSIDCGLHAVFSETHAFIWQIHVQGTIPLSKPESVKNNPACQHEYWQAGLVDLKTHIPVGCCELVPGHFHRGQEAVGHVSHSASRV